jgi:hypothetical protein
MAPTGGVAAGSVVELNSGCGEAVAVGPAEGGVTALGDDEADGGGSRVGSALSFPGATPPHDASDHVKQRPMTPGRVTRPPQLRFHVIECSVHCV